jgi:hypothetical protein
MGYAKKDVQLRKVWVQANDIEVGPSPPANVIDIL